MTETLRIDFHFHTHASRDSLTTPEKLIATCRRRGLDRVVVTDHNTITGALAAHALDPERVIVGEEVMTTRGELLAAFVSEEVPKGLPPEEAIRRLRAQGAFISVSHPFDVMRNGSWRLPDLVAILPLVDAIEIFNARCLSNTYNKQAADFARQKAIPGTAGSDGHAAFELGAASLVLPSFRDADGLRKGIGQGRVVGRRSPWWVHLASIYARSQKS